MEMSCSFALMFPVAKNKLMKESIFGTDGIRGLVNHYPITAEIALKIGIAIGVYVGANKSIKRVVIAKDTRLSGYMIEPALTSGLISTGVDVILVGPMPTPSVPMLIKSLRADFGIMILHRIIHIMIMVLNYLIKKDVSLIRMLAKK